MLKTRLPTTIWAHYWVFVVHKFNGGKFKCKVPTDQLHQSLNSLSLNLSMVRIARSVKAERPPAVPSKCKLSKGELGGEDKTTESEGDGDDRREGTFLE